MKKLFAAASYSFNSFYNNLNTQGQMVFSIILFLIAVLCILLFLTYVAQGIKYKAYIKKLKKKKSLPEVKLNVKNDKVNPVLEKTEVLSDKNEEENNEISDIAKRVEDAIKEEQPINLTSFEEDQEKMAIISIDELMARAKDLQIIEDEDSEGINYLEKFNLQPAEVCSLNKDNDSNVKQEVKAFKVSQVISPIYGIKKEVINEKND